jgi:hypothetical protein
VEHLVGFLRDFAPYLALAVFLALVVLAINLLGRRLEKHDEWLAQLDVRLGNLHKERAASWAQSLQRPYPEAGPPIDIVPPPLPPRAPTLNATDWRDDALVTEELMTKQTGRYPLGTPPKGPNDDHE